MKINYFYSMVAIAGVVFLNNAAFCAPADSNNNASQAVAQIEVPPEVDKPTDKNKMFVWNMCTSLSGTKYYEGTLVSKRLLPARLMGDRACAMNQLPCPPIDEKKESAQLNARFEYHGKQMGVALGGTTFELKKIEAQMVPGKNYSFCGIYKSDIFRGIVVDHLESFKQED